MPRIQSYHLHLPLLHVDHHHNSKMLYAIRICRDMLAKLSLIFLPIFLYEQKDKFLPMLFTGPPLARGILLIAAFYFVVRLTALCTALPLARLTKGIGHSRTLVLAHLVWLLFFVALKQSSDWFFLIFVAAVLDGLEVNLFWTSYQTLMTKHSLKRHLGEDLGLQQFLLQLFSLLVPALGATIVTWFGFSYLFMAGLVFLLLGLIFSLHLDPQPESERVSWLQLRQFMKEKEFKSFALSVAGQYFNDAVLMLWPVYLFILLGNIERVGFLYTFSFFISLLLSLAIGAYLDHRHSRRPFYVSGSILTLMWLLRTQIVTFWQIGIVEAIDRITANFHWLFFTTALFRNNKGKTSFSHFVYREIIISAAALLFWGGVGVLFAVLGGGWKGLFVVGAIGVACTTLLREQRLDVHEKN